MLYDPPQKQPSSAGALCFWMSNCCELLHFLKRDSELQPITAQSRKQMSRLLHIAYRSLVQCLQKELAKHLPTFLLDPEIHGALPKGIELVLNTLMTSMSLLRRCKVHPALSIQLFSQLFHFISAWLFNRLLAAHTDPPALRSHHWGATLRHRLTLIEAWAERQGLELAADCHLALIIQATSLLTMDHSVEVKEAQSCCSRLSPQQIRTLLQGYSYSRHQRSIPAEWISSLVSARSSSDQSQDVLEESLTLTLPLLLPEQGYCSQTLRGIPPGLAEFMEPVCTRGLCSLTPQPGATGDWTVHFGNSASSTETTYLEAPREPEVESVTLNKPLNSGMGLSIVAAKGAGQSHLGIYIKSIVRGGPAEMNGRLSCGDQLLSVDGHGLTGVSQESAVETLMQTGPVVTLEVAKYAAGFHGLEELLRESPQERGAEHFNHTEVRSNGSSMVHSSSMAELGSSSSSSRRQREVKLQRNRQLYRSNPNILNLVLEEEEEAAREPGVRGTKMAAHSAINLCSGSHYSCSAAEREYLTLPSPKHKDISEPSQQPMIKQETARAMGQSCKRNTFMRQALSHENLLCTDLERPLVDKRPEMQLLQRSPLRNSPLLLHSPVSSPLSSFPMRQSLSAHDILSERPRQFQNANKTGPVIWHQPFRNDPMPATSIQPIRIDKPLTRAGKKNPPLTTFQSPSQQTGQKILGNSAPKQMGDRIYDCPVARKSCLGGQVNGGKPQVNVIPTKHVSFRMDGKPKEGKGEREERGRWDVWRREEMERQEEQRRLQKVGRFGSMQYSGCHS